MKNDLSDLINDLVPDINISSELDDLASKFDPALFQSSLDELDPDDFAPNRTANSAEQMVEKLDTMMEAFEKTSSDQRKRDRVDRAIAIATLLVSAIGAAAAVYQIFG